MQSDRVYLETAYEEQPAGRPGKMTFPPPPPRDGPASSPAGGSNVTQPLRLATNILSGLNNNHLATPLSTTSLFSPSSQLRSAGYNPSPGPGSRGVSPMASRTPAYNVPYNPGEWVSGNQRASQAEERNRSGAQAEDGIDAPPPPYSPAPTRDSLTCTSASSIVSPGGSTFSHTFTSQANTPTSTLGVASPWTPGPSLAREMLAPSASGSRTSSQQYYAPPPPGRPSQAINNRQGAPTARLRPNSVASLSVVVNSSQYVVDSDDTSDPQPFPFNRPPAAKRAVSADAASNSNSSCQSREQSVSRSSSNQDSWQPGNPLPGPPPGPPPNSSRSQSASGVFDVQRRQPSHSTARSQRKRNTMRAPALGPVPPTPAGWTEDQPMRPTTKPSSPLHIQTTNLDHMDAIDSRISSNETATDSSTGPSLGSSALTRSGGVRDSSVKGLRERRKLRRSTGENESSELSALSVNNNPWAEALRTSSRNSKSPTISTDQNYGQVDDSANGATNITPKALPTPPLSQKAPYSAHSVLTSASSSDVGFDQSDLSDDIAASLQRHREFILKEAQANTEVEKLTLFGQYIVAESRLRRKQYASAFVHGHFEQSQVSDKLFEDTADTLETKERAYERSDFENQQGSVERATNSRLRHESTRMKDYQPALSPIASMSNDELSSRGRAPSRWWESQTGSNSDGIGQKLKRSKRESKYMGLSAALMQSEFSETNTPTNADFNIQGRDGSYPEEKANPETFGIYDEEEPVPTGTKSKQKSISPLLRDISRFITLPPPYPRHYPAVNNSHPDLAGYRNTVRTLSDLSEIRARKDRHNVSVEALRSDHRQKQAQARQSFKENIRSQLEEGSITYAEAAEAEDALRLEQHESDRKSLQAEFDMLHDVVIKPLHELLNDRLVRLDGAIDELHKKIIVEAQDQSADHAQREGDDTPEMLEYLTQAKWLFETREQVHKEIFELFTERNNQYKLIVLLPYQQAKNGDKVRNTEAFFVRDSLDRQTNFYTESLVRHQRLFEIIEENIDLAIESQSSAFWDIAPGIADLLQELPTDFYEAGEIAIPDREYLENPSYHQFPQQYLYSLLDHAEKSAYQFIESQTNLHCLLHEVKNGLLISECRLKEAKKANQNENIDADFSDSTQLRSGQEALLTAHLKQKVSLIEEQWLEALGSQLQGTKERIMMMLQENGGWDDIEQAGV